MVGVNDESVTDGEAMIGLCIACVFGIRRLIAGATSGASEGINAWLSGSAAVAFVATGVLDIPLATVGTAGLRVVVRR